MTYKSFDNFLESITQRGLGAAEMLAMEMKSAGLYVSRGLSFKQAEVDTYCTPAATSHMISHMIVYTSHMTSHMIIYTSHMIIYTSHTSHMIIYTSYMISHMIYMTHMISHMIIYTTHMTSHMIIYTSHMTSHMIIYMTHMTSHMISHNPYGQSQEQLHVPLQFTMLEVPLNDEQVKVYDTAAHVW